MEVKFQKMREDCILPKYAHAGDACMDCYANENMAGDVISIGPGETFSIDLGFSVELPENHVMLLFARSGLACKNGLRLANDVGVIDSSFNGHEVKCVIYNDSKDIKSIENHTRVCQAMILPYPVIEIVEGEVNMIDKDRTGFGSSGIN